MPSTICENGEHLDGVFILWCSKDDDGPTLEQRENKMLGEIVS